MEKKSPQGKLFITNFTFGAMSVFSSFMRVCLLCDMSNHSLHRSSMKSQGDIREPHSVWRLVTVHIISFIGFLVTHGLC